MEGSKNTAHSFLLESWLDLGQAVEQFPALRKMLFDPVTDLPTTPLLFPRIASLLEERGEVSLLCVNIVRYSRIEEIYGWQVFDDVMREVAAILDGIAGERFRDADVIAELMNTGNTFVIVLSPPRTRASMQPQDRDALVRRLEVRIHEELAGRIAPALFRKFGCYVGAVTVRATEGVRLERLIYDGLETALSDSHSRQSADSRTHVAGLQAVLDAEDISTMMHPIFDLGSMQVIGYEALSRGPQDSEFERPDKLFSAAYDHDLVTRLDRVCRKSALEAARSIPAGRLLFMNVEPEAVGDPQLREMVLSSADAGGLQPSSIVLELTERTAITDFCAFRSTLQYVRALGFGVAIDDAGAGYGSLQCLAEIHPEWLKIDLSLVRGCDSDEVRVGLIESLLSYAEKVGARLIAEGIETEAELAALRSIGVRYGQGFLLAPPVEGVPADSDLSASRFMGRESA